MEAMNNEFKSQEAIGYASKLGSASQDFNMD
jgi:hypothetical protein